MTLPVRVLTTKIVDEYGGIYPEAVVAIRLFSESSQSTGVSNDSVSPYQVEQEIDAISYSASYWYSQKTKQDGKRSRPLVVEVDSEFTDLLTVDLESQLVIDALQGQCDPTERILRAICADIKNRFK